MSFIELIDVKKIFKTKTGTLTAVNDVSLSIDKGDIFGIVGYSGAGKSTLVRLFNGLETVTSGEVLVHGEEVKNLKGKNLRDFRKRIGMIFQHFNLLWSRTVLENIMLPLEINGVSKKERQERAEELLKLVGLEGRGSAYPSQLSGGQKQRVGIARALANQPEILLCDEATSALDPQTTDEVLELLMKINQELQLTIVLITHEMHVIRKICNKVAVMEKGKIIETGNVIDVFRHPKSDVTKRFVEQELFTEEEHRLELLEELQKSNPDGVLVNLTFKGESSKNPALSQAIQKYQITVNVLQGQIQRAKDTSIGVMTMQLTGEKENIDASLQFFKDQNLGVEVIGGDDLGE